MEPVSPVIPGSNLDEIQIAKDQPEYRTLPVILLAGGVILSRWALDEAEKLVVESTGDLYIHLLTFGNEPPYMMFQVDSPIAGDTPEEILKLKTSYPGLTLPVIHRDENSVWMLLHLTDEDRATIVREGSVYFFMNTEGRPITPSLIQVETPVFGDEVEYMIGLRKGAKTDAIARQFGIEMETFNCCVCAHETVVSRQIVPRIKELNLKVLCKICAEGSALNICVAPETIEEFRQAINKNSEQ